MSILNNYDSNENELQRDYFGLKCRGFFSSLKSSKSAFEASGLGSESKQSMKFGDVEAGA